MQFLLPFFLFLSTTLSYTFHPDNSSLFPPTTSHLPLTFDPQTSQTLLYRNASSWYSISFITTTTSEQFVLLSHTIPYFLNNTGFHRSSILDLGRLGEEGAYWSDETLVTTPASIVGSNGGLSISYPDGYTFEALSNDSLHLIRTTQSNPSLPLAFNLTWSLDTTPILLNGGLGSLALGASSGAFPSVTTEWSVPACLTSGSFAYNGTSYSVNPEETFTWYDRQWDGIPPQNWTWFGLHVGAEGSNETDTVLSCWAIQQADPAVPARDFCTVRLSGGGMLVQPYTLTALASSEWTSPSSNYTYYTSHTLTWPDGSIMNVTSVLQDQELVAPPEVGVTTSYEGFVNVRGRLDGKAIEGFGVVEMVHFFPAPA